MKPTDLAKYLTRYLTSYLPDTRGLSTNTIASRRDTFALFFSYLQDEKKINPSKAHISSLDAETVTGFLDWLENTRGCSASTRNLRLSALKAFFLYIQTQTPDHMYLCQQIAALPLKKCPGKSIEYLTLDGIKAILDVVDTATPAGRRDLVLLSVLYDSAARVQEIADLKVGDIRLPKPSTIRLTGKGNKTRVVPLMDSTARLLHQYLDENTLHPVEHYNHPVFKNRSGTKLTRAGITYILDKYVTIAKQSYPALMPKDISPHSFRHSKSMHMLQAGVPLIYIRDFLGHAEISTTEVYARCDSSQKRKAIEAAYPNIQVSALPSWQSDDGLMNWLKSLC
ncbi:MAG: site-specific integrase [Firmicutes bacterium]|nr:site-specific integrase [Bacillota bacterium]